MGCLLATLVLLLVVCGGGVGVWASDFDIVKDRILQSLLDDYTKTDVSKANLYASSLSSLGSWSDVDYRSGCNISGKSFWPADNHLVRVTQMARAWRAPASTLYHNATLESKIFLALSYWFRNDYTNEACAHYQVTGAGCPCSTPGFWHLNFWWNEIGMPSDMGKACLLISSSASFATKGLAGCTHVLARGSFNYGMNGANALWQAQVIIYKALVNNNASLLAATYNRAKAELAYTPGIEEGIKSDGQFLQHDALVYTGGYGYSFLKTFIDLMLPTVGTSYAVSDTKQQEVFSKYILEGHRWVTSYPSAGSPQASFDFNVMGRELARSVTNIPADRLQPIVNITAGWAQAADFQKYLQLLAGNTSVSPPVGNRMYSSSNLMIHRRPGYFVSVRGFSARLGNAECINLENLYGLHLGDGATYVYQTSSDYLYTPMAWDWDHIPGITVDPMATVLGCNTTRINPNRRFTTFVGGYSDGDHGIFAFDFKGVFTSKLTYHKSWFFFNNAFVVLVSNISTTNTGQPVHHVLDSRVHRGPATMLSAGATATSSVSSGTASAYPWWLHHDSIGYVFPANRDRNSLRLSWKMANITSSWSATATFYSKTLVTVDLFTAWLESKAPPVTADSVAYIASPKIGLSSFETRASQLLSVVRIIQNTPTVQAVYQSELGILSVVFWAGNVTFKDDTLGWVLTPDRPCIVQITSYSNSAVVTFGVADPTQNLTQVVLRVNNAASCGSCSGSSNGTAITFSFLPTRNYARVNATIATASTTAAPMTAAPTTKAPTTAAPTTAVPTTAAPTTKAPTTAAPTTKAPTTAAPTTKASTTAAPTTKAPTTAAPTTKVSTTTSPTSVSAVSTSPHEATISWAPPSSGTVSQYRVGRDGVDSTGKGAWSGLVAPTARIQTFIFLLPNTNYNVFVEAIFTDGTTGQRVTVLVHTMPADYVGCFLDQVSPRALTGLTTTSSFFNSTSMTVKACQNFCGLRGYAYAGLQHGDQCWCGQVISNASRVPETECATPCSGNQTLVCGSSWRNSVYLSAPTGYLGCYIDSSTKGRDLSTKAASSANMTIEWCLSLCKAKNFSYAGLQWARECWCGNSFGRYGKDAFASCNSTCAGDATQMCGAGLHNSVYALGPVVRAESSDTSGGGGRAFPIAVVVVCSIVGVLVAAALLLIAVWLVAARRRQRSMLQVREQLLSPQ